MALEEIADSVNSSVKNKKLKRPLNVMLIQIVLAQAFNEESCAWALKQYDIGFVIDGYLRLDSLELRKLKAFEDICNDWTYVPNIVKSALYDDIIKYCDWPMAKIMAGISGTAYQFDTTSSVANNTAAMTAVINSETAMTAVNNSDIAIGKYVASLAKLNPADYANMTAVANNTAAMTSIADSEAAITAMVESQVAMMTVADRDTALAGISKVANSSTLFKWLKKVNETTDYIAAIANTMKNSTLFTNSHNSGYDSVAGANSKFSSGNVIGLCCCGYYSSSSTSVNMLLNNTSVFTGKTGYSKPSTGSTNTNAIAIRDCTFTETGDGYLGISVYTLK